MFTPRTPRHAHPQHATSHRRRARHAAALTAPQAARPTTLQHRDLRDRLAHARFSVTLALCVALVAAGNAAVDLGHGGRASLAQTESANIVRVSDVADTYVSYAGAKTQNYGSETRITTSNAAGKPAPTSALFGGTPRGASNAGGVAAMDSDYGPAKVVRLFWSGGARTSTVTDRRVVGSIKTVDSDTAAWASKTWRWTYMHEIDSKIKKGQYTLAAWRSKMESLVALKVPGLSVILTANAFDNPSKNPSDYLVPGVTHLGVDFDGISQSAGYHDYSKELSAVVAFTKTHNLTWGVGEFGANRASNDPSGTARAAWLKNWAGKFAAAGAEYVLLWENNSQAGSDFTTSAETAAVRELLAK